MNRLARDILKSNLILWLVLASMNVNGQTSGSGKIELQNNFIEAVTNLHQEKVYVHTDRQLYLTGETIWMSAYCVDAALHVPVDVSKVLNIELIDSNGQSMKQERIQLNSGLGKGQIFVSPDIKTGTYVLCAFTNWMKNFDTDFVFTKQITILNPSDIPDNEQQVSDQQTIVEFFPEGGNLIDNINGKVAVKVSNSFAEGLTLTGVVYDDQDEEITKFTTSDLGFGSFWLTPEKEKSYSVRIVVDSVVQKYDLPLSQSEGVALSVSYTNESEYQISINASDNQIRPLYLVIHSRGIIKTITRIESNISKKIEVPSESMKPGVTHVSLLDEEFNPLAERLVFKYPEQTELVKLNIGNKIHRKREKVSFSIAKNSINSVDAISNISVSVYKSTNQVCDENIVSDLLLTSDIKGVIKKPWMYFDPSNKLRKEQLDLLLLTQGWRRFNWNDIKNGAEFDPDFKAELNAPILSGTFKRIELLPSTLNMSFPGKTSFMNSISLSNEGRFWFEAPLRMEDEKVYFYINRDSLRSEDLDLEDPFELELSSTGDSKFNISDYSMEYLDELYENIQFSQVYREHNQINGEVRKEQSVTTHFYGKPDIVYNLDDYTRFGTVKDLFIEYVRSGAIKKKDNKTRFYITKRDAKNIPAFVMIDGVPILDTEIILNFDPSLLKEIELVDRTYFLGNSQFNGMINFTTYNGDFGGQDMPEYLIEKAYKGIQMTREFYSPDYANIPDKIKRIPDYRNTIYWNPSITLKSDIEVGISFYTSDKIGNYKIEINGITNSGKPIYQTAAFTVTNALP